METYNYENLRKNKEQINAIFNKVNNIKTKINSKANSINYNDIYDILHNQVRKLEKVEDNLQSYIKGITKICDDSLEEDLEINDDTVIPTITVENVATQEFIEYLNNNKSKMLKK